MRQRGRKSAASFETINVDGSPDRLQPPDHLSADERRRFTEIVSNCDARHFRPSDATLLCRFVEADALAERAAKELRKHPVVDGKPSAWITFRKKAFVHRRRCPCGCGCRRKAGSTAKASAVTRCVQSSIRGSGHRMKTPGKRAANWVENFCVVPFGFDKGQHVRLSIEQKEILRKLFDTDESPGEIAAALPSYLVLLALAGPRALAERLSGIALNADVFTTWAAVGPDLKSVLRIDGGTIVCQELRTRYPAAA